jgi:predicted ester cyclase
MSTEQNKAVARRFTKAFETNDQAAFREVLSPDLVAYTAHLGGPVNRETMLQGITAFHGAFSEIRVTLEDLIAEEDRVATRGTTRALHTGSFQGAPPTGKQVTFSTMSVERIQEGRIVERWVNTDFMALMQQLGLIPPPQGHR